MNNSFNINTVQTPGLRSASALLKNTDNQIIPSIVQSNLLHCTPTSSPQVNKNNVTKPVGSSTVHHHQVTHQKATEDNTKPSISQGTNVIVISDEANLTMLLLQNKKNLIFCTNSFPSLNTQGKKSDPW